MIKITMMHDENELGYYTDADWMVLKYEHESDEIQGRLLNPEYNQLHFELFLIWRVFYFLVYRVPVLLT